MKRLLSIFLTTLITACSVLADETAKFQAASLFGDHMVVQRGVPVKIWGTGKPGSNITATINGKSAEGLCDKDGNWKLEIPPLDIGEPRELKISDGEDEIHFKDVLVGEVWICAGQSNMRKQLSSSIGADEEIQKATYPALRVFDVTITSQTEPQRSCEGEWKICSPETAAGFSAVAYHFGKLLHTELNVPIGLIHAAKASTPIESWTSREAQMNVPLLEQALNRPDSLKDYLRYPKPSANDARIANYYNGMIAPLIPYTLRGVIWYQGENNADNGFPELYGLRLKTLITDWRERWGQDDFPFIWVQLPNLYPYRELEGWSLVQEQMLKTLEVPNTGMAITIDTAKEQDLHPKNKKPVGERLAKWALGTVYKKKMIYSGPLFEKAEIADGKVKIHFKHAQGLKTSNANSPEGFMIAGQDQKFVPAGAEIQGETVTVSAASVKDPAAVRYAWNVDPAENLVNSAGLPASPFRTDNWKFQNPTREEKILKKAKPGKKPKKKAAE